jgi:hypothetical protein
VAALRGNASTGEYFGRFDRGRLAELRWTRRWCRPLRAGDLVLRPSVERSSANCWPNHPMMARHRTTTWTLHPGTLRKRTACGFGQAQEQGPANGDARLRIQTLDDGPGIISQRTQAMDQVAPYSRIGTVLQVGPHLRRLAIHRSAIPAFASLESSRIILYFPRKPNTLAARCSRRIASS